jgi:hypothetical protein
MAAPRREQKYGKFQCSSCNEWKIKEEFYIKSTGRPESHCIICKKQASTLRQVEQPREKEKIKEYNRKRLWYKVDVYASCTGC